MPLTHMYKVKKYVTSKDGISVTLHCDGMHVRKCLLNFLEAWNSCVDIRTNKLYRPRLQSEDLSETELSNSNPKTFSYKFIKSRKSSGEKVELYIGFGDASSKLIEVYKKSLKDVIAMDMLRFWMF